ncbi:hypothetical protein C2845_PM01G35720 [Panicum miliaceum]|uniref:Uncharacterized protein n=1 Tax=Panicum miliaceum TaxID=4540 RepID=A0A3L6TDZ5_PANMI|nr:hypothetical protein C2845_PM01G35720 [Panicum miliaceum]
MRLRRWRRCCQGCQSECVVFDLQYRNIMTYEETRQFTLVGQMLELDELDWPADGAAWKEKACTAIPAEPRISSLDAALPKQVHVKAKKEIVDKVCDIVKKQLITFADATVVADPPCS